MKNCLKCALPVEFDEATRQELSTPPTSEPGWFPIVFVCCPRCGYVQRWEDGALHRLNQRDLIAISESPSARHLYEMQQQSTAFKICRAAELN